MLKGATSWTEIRGQLSAGDRDAIAERVSLLRHPTRPHDPDLMPELGEIELLVDDEGHIVPPNEPAPKARAKQ